MKKEHITRGEYSQLLESTRYSDSTKYDEKTIIEIYEYLKDKITDEIDYDGKRNILDHLHLDFLRIALERTYFLRKYNQGTEDFLKSDFLAEDYKQEIASILGKNMNSKKLQDCSIEEIKEIEESLDRLCRFLPNNKKKQKCELIMDIYEEYLFIIDGEGPKEYLKEKYGSNLPILLLEKSGIPSQASYYSGYEVDSRYLGEKHLFSLYQKIDKYYPEKVDNYSNLVKTISRLTPTEFVINYISFVKKGLELNFDTRTGNTSLDGLDNSMKDIVKYISIINSINSNHNNSYMEHLSIRNKFKKMVEEYKNRDIKEELENEKIIIFKK